jgi:hypothetical protein
MNLERLGSLHPFRLSFMRTLVRRIMKEKWSIEHQQFELDANGFGTVIYEITTPNGLYSFVIFAHYLDDSLRSDRVIAEQWDMTVTLCEGRVDAEHLNMLRDNVPLQEQGRIDSRSIVLSRANKSVRNFEYVIGELAAGRQPALANIAKVGYLYRTTAVYGSGKFGMADWQKVAKKHPDLARPFAAEMLSCYLIRQFSLEQADHIARHRAPSTAVAMAPGIKRYFGIGNATGLGMAPYLTNHPLLVSRWIEVRETALARVLLFGDSDLNYQLELGRLLRRAHQHLLEIDTDNIPQQERNTTTANELEMIAVSLSDQPFLSWQSLIDDVAVEYALETQEVVNSLLIEMYPELVDDLENTMSLVEEYQCKPQQKLSDVVQLIEDHYAWALAIDFDTTESRATFWYRSQEKMEPRLGVRGTDPGDEKSIDIAMALNVRRCYEQLKSVLRESADQNIAEFALTHPEFRSVLRRIQTMSETFYGDIQANLIDAEVLPIHLLRCKLSFFGVSKFDPKSRLWVRNTMFQGAPLTSDIGDEFKDDWYFPIMPAKDGSRANHADDPD